MRREALHVSRTSNPQIAPAERLVCLQLRGFGRYCCNHLRIGSARLGDHRNAASQKAAHRTEPTVPKDAYELDPRDIRDGVYDPVNGEGKLQPDQAPHSFMPASPPILWGKATRSTTSLKPPRSSEAASTVERRLAVAREWFECSEFLRRMTREDHHRSLRTPSLAIPL
jgi:hypothetical protein